MTITKVKNYQDITKFYLDKKIKKIGKVISKIEILEYYELDGKKYYIDGKYIKICAKDIEIQVAKFLKDTFGETVYLIPKVDYPPNIPTPDYLWQEEYWDLKEILGNSKRNVDDKIKKAKLQSSNFIIDNSKLIMSNEEAIRQIEHIYRDKERWWVDKIILIENNKIIKAFKRVKE